MPELPEVETTVRGINRYVAGKKIIDVWSGYNSSFHAGKDNIKNRKYFEKVFCPSVKGEKIILAQRRAKNILVKLSGGKTILVHMKMTGHLLYGKYTRKGGEWVTTADGPLKDPFNRFLRLVFSLSDDKHLVLSDMRKFAKVTLLDSQKLDETADLQHIGPEPLAKNFSNKIMIERLSLRPNWKIKQALMGQELIAGIGNIYSDEILWSSSIHPERRVKDISAKEFSAMYKDMIQILTKGIREGGDSMSDYRNLLGEKGNFQNCHRAYRQTGKSCTKRGCRGIIMRKVVGGRSAHFCPIHQI